jgi:hypothetical protein
MTMRIFFKTAIMLLCLLFIGCTSVPDDTCESHAKDSKYYNSSFKILRKYKENSKGVDLYYCEAESFYLKDSFTFQLAFLKEGSSWIFVPQWSKVYTSAQREK